MEVVLETKKFLDILNVARLARERDAAQLMFEKSGIHVNVRNPANTLGCYAEFRESYFKTYSIDEEFAISIPMHKFLKMLKHISASEISIDVKEDKIVVNDGELEAPLLQYDPNVCIPQGLKLVETEFGSVIVSDDTVVEHYNFSRIQIPKQINLLGVEDVAFTVKNKTLLMCQEDDIGHKIRNVLSSMMDKYVNDVEVKINATLLKTAFDTLISGECYIAIGTNHEKPLLIQLCDNANDYIVTVAAAPKIDE